MKNMGVAALLSLLAFVLTKCVVDDVVESVACISLRYQESRSQLCHEGSMPEI